MQRTFSPLFLCLLVTVLLGVTPLARAQTLGAHSSTAISHRVAPRPYLGMPHRANGKIPALLSQTGAFRDTAHLIPARGLIPYDLAVAFWSDGADKGRWVAVPSGKIKFSLTGEWIFPNGSVFVKTFELPTDARDPTVKHRLETRLLVRDDTGGVYGALYKWRSDNSDADLLDTDLTEIIPMKSLSGAVTQQTWYFPSRQDCLTCHNAKAGGVLGPKTRQMNHAFAYSDGGPQNELLAWNRWGLFSPAVRNEDLANVATLAPAGDASRSLQDRARSYLDANCAQCHRPGGTVAYFDARFDTPLDKQSLIDGPVLLDQGIDRPRVISPHDIWRSIAYLRVNTLGDVKMPPVARETIDQQGVELLRAWILSLPGQPVLEPPSISPQGGTFDGSVEVTLVEREPGADIHYTLDGSVPGKADPRYEQPIRLTAPTVVRTRAFKEGFTRSITEQQVFILAK
jgi:uncharacterized repeat protein (TIGR03806 family)